MLSPQGPPPTEKQNCRTRPDQTRPANNPDSDLSNQPRQPARLPARLPTNQPDRPPVGLGWPGKLPAGLAGPSAGQPSFQPASQPSSQPGSHQTSQPGPQRAWAGRFLFALICFKTLLAWLGKCSPPKAPEKKRARPANKPASNPPSHQPARARQLAWPCGDTALKGPLFFFFRNAPSP